MLGATIERLEDFDPLQGADRQVADQSIGIDTEAILALQPRHFLPRRRGAAAQQEAALRTEHDVFQHGERIDQHEMLMHHADTERDGGAGAGDVDGFSVNQDLAAVGLVKAVENAHQRRFAGAILADDAGDRARRRR